MCIVVYGVWVVYLVMEVSCGQGYSRRITHLVSKPSVSPGIEVPHLQRDGGIERVLVESISLGIAACSNLKPNSPQPDQHHSRCHSVYIGKNLSCSCHITWQWRDVIYYSIWYPLGTRGITL